MEIKNVFYDFVIICFGKEILIKVIFFNCWKSGIFGFFEFYGNVSKDMVLKL